MNIWDTYLSKIKDNNNIKCMTMGINKATKTIKIKTLEIVKECE